MGFRLFVDETPWEQSRKDTRDTAASLAADEGHAAMAVPLRELLVQWGVIDQERRDADDAMVDANAAVRRFDKMLDRCVGKLVSRLLFETDQSRQDKGYTRYFPEAPNEVIRLGLESQIKVTRRYPMVAEEIGASPEVGAILARMKQIQAQGTTVLEQRVEVAKTQGRVSLRISAWKESANAARRSVENGLDAYAIANNLPRDYPEEFFPPRRRSKKKKSP